VNDSVNCVAGATAASVGGDVYFLSQTGVFRVRQIVQDRAETAAEAVSEPIRPYIERINFAAIAKANAVMFGRYYWLAVPLDEATEPNAILRYDTLSQAWQGIDTYHYGDGLPVQVHALIVAPYQGKARLYAVDFNRPCVHLLEEGRLEVSPIVLSSCIVTAGALHLGLSVDGLYKDSGATFNGQPVYVREDGLFKIYQATGDATGWTLTRVADSPGDDFWFGGTSVSNPSSADSHTYQASGGGASGTPEVEFLPGVDVTKTHRHITSRLRSRAYTLSENEDKRFVRGLLKLKGWAPSFRVDTVLPGVGDSDEVIPVTVPDRTKYKTFGTPDYDPGNPNDNHAAPDREDYSVDIGTPFDPDDAGIDFSLEQARTEPFTVRRQGRHLQLEITNTAGTLVVVSTQTDADPGTKTLRSR
jgi:hypothetical protein